MKDCIFKNGKCIYCGFETTLSNARRHCPSFKTQEKNTVKLGPNVFKKAINFSSAVFTDLSTGMKRCTDEEIDRRLSICKECPFYVKINEEQGECSKCGCPLSRGRVYRNKVYWESQHCPDNPPRW